MRSHRYEHVHVAIRLDGHLDYRWSDWFAGLALVHEPDGTTTLRGTVTDQAQLHGILAQVRDLGATLISVIPLDEHGPTDGDPSGPSEAPPAQP